VSGGGDKTTVLLADVLGPLPELRGDDYLEPIRRRAAAEAILVTMPVIIT